MRRWAADRPRTTPSGGPCAPQERGLSATTPRRDWPPQLLRGVFHALSAAAPRSALGAALAASAGTAASSWRRRRRLAASLGATSMLGHLLGLGDRRGPPTGLGRLAQAGLGGVSLRCDCEHQMLALPGPACVREGCGHTVTCRLRGFAASSLTADPVCGRRRHMVNILCNTVNAFSTAANIDLVHHPCGRHMENILLLLGPAAAGSGGGSGEAAGCVVHIDLSVCWDKGSRLRVPEVVPFRCAGGGLGVKGGRHGCPVPPKAKQLRKTSSPAVSATSQPSFSACANVWLRGARPAG